MDGLLCYIFKGLVKNEYLKIRINMIENDNEIAFQITIPHNMKSSIIGKDGKIINAVRDYFKAISKKFGNKRIFIKVNEV
ncbi:MAG: KH domain-containing protein [Elusimicrobiales bacterium]|nr:KH domain-containing protein [Elusimicrobiales bacterium]